jgi:hypothetical protein
VSSDRHSTYDGQQATNVLRELTTLVVPVVYNSGHANGPRLVTVCPVLWLHHKVAAGGRQVSCVSIDFP